MKSRTFLSFLTLHLPASLVSPQPPIKTGAWPGVLEANIEGANCVQKDFVYQNNYTGSEDCLYLNVYSPQIHFAGRNSDLKPVLVWIHGGSYKSGYGNSSLYGPDFLIEEGLVVVTFNYRLGPLGFLSLNHEDAAGNAGLKDQNLALRWVNENIIYFGGDPNTVTLCGQSAGGVAVDLHVLSEMSQGLFHRAISMSASCLCPWAFHNPQTAEEQALSLAKSLGIDTRNKKQLLQELRDIPAVELVRAAEEMGTMGPPFRPSLESMKIAPGESKFLTKCSYDKYKNGNFTQVPHLTGLAKDETLLYVEGLLPVLNWMDTPDNDVGWMSSMSRAFPFIRNRYKSLSHRILMQLIEETTNLLFVRGIDAKRKMLARNMDQPVYYYHFCHTAKEPVHRLLYNITLDGTAHGDDLGYLFHMKVIDLPLNPRDPAMIIRRRVARLWSNFAKYGDPTPPRQTDDLLQGLKWPESNRSGNYLHIDDKLIVRSWNSNPRDRLYELIYDIVMPSQIGC